MHTRSARNKETGLFTVVCHDWNGNVFFEGQFADMHEADEAGSDAERRMTISMQQGPAASLDEVLEELDDIELLLGLTT